MTDTTHEAPERIWATMMDSECARSGTFVDLKEYSTKPNYDATEYVRADLVQATVAAALLEVDKAIQAVADNCTTEDGHLAIVAAVEKVRSFMPQDAQAALDRVVAAERERCAKVAQQHAQIAQEQVTRLMKEHGSKTAENIWTGRLVAAQEVEAAIRKGGE